jgi:hypothetical protein
MTVETTPLPATATERSRARFSRATRVLGGITLDQQHTDMLAAILADTGENAAAWVRRMIREHTPNGTA